MLVFGLPRGHVKQGLWILSQLFQLFRVHGNDVRVVAGGFEAGRCEFDKEVSVRTRFGFWTGCAFQAGENLGVLLKPLQRSVLSTTHCFSSGLNPSPCSEDWLANRVNELILTAGCWSKRWGTGGGLFPLVQKWKQAPCWSEMFLNCCYRSHSIDEWKWSTARGYDRDVHAAHPLTDRPQPSQGVYVTPT